MSGDNDLSISGGMIVSVMGEAATGAMALA